MKSSKNKIILLLILWGWGVFTSLQIKAEIQSEHMAKDTVSVTILQTADIHGQLDPHPELFWENDSIIFKTRGGLAHIKTLFDKERQKNPGRTLIVDGGDLIQGSGYAALSQGSIFPGIIRNMGYDLLIPGNWEVVYGKESMMNVLNAYGTPVIAQNMFSEKDGDALFPAYWIKEIEGVKIGFIGINDPDVPERQNPSFSKGMDFTGLDKNVEKLIKEVKHHKKVDVLFMVTHIGIFKQVELANSEMAKDVDYILGNDTHERVRRPIEGKFAKVTEPGAFGSFVGKLILHLVDGKIVGEEYELLEVDPEKYPADPEIHRLVEEAKAPYKDHLETVIGYTETPLFRYLTVENPMDNMITDAARWKTGADISISNGFRFGNPIVPENGGPAPITRANLWNLLPVNEKVKMGKATGKQIRDWLEKEMNNVFAQDPSERFGGWLVRFSGMTVTFNSQKPDGERIVSIEVSGQPMQNDEVYTVSACERPGDPHHMLCRLPNTKDVEVMDYTIHDVVEDYLQEHSPVSPVLDGRALSLDLEAYSFSNVPGTEYEFK
ncbi:bifunctional metallophosphatase/5'-nucleotidase [Negadavirga shengliensis]|uniref:Bifunctional metallophosphatase/5'-nucleotidase n=1 Tax=Negadavirga shengliensis TaxID=1389218 RepID=A0ABV9SUN3_9BACT